MKLSELLKYCNGNLIGEADLDIEVNKFSIDSRNIKENMFFIPLKGENSDGHDYINSAFENGAIGTLTNKSIENVPGKIIIQVSDTLKALQDIAKNFRIENSEIPLVAITGSVGKTTTKDMIYSVLSKKFNTLKTSGNFNNEIGMPLTLINYDDQDMIVLEMGMSEFGEISLLSNIAKPNVSVITNVGHSHIGNLGSRENILKAKMEIVEGMNEDGYLLINSDNDMLSTVKNVNQKLITFGFEKEADVMAYNIKISENSTSFNIKEDGEEFLVKLNLIGEKFIYNSLAAWIIGKLYGVPIIDRIEALEKCEFTKMRMNIKEVNNMILINDCYNASPESMKLALQALSKQNSDRKIAILGDMLELGEYSKRLHEEVGKNVGIQKVDKLIITGEFAEDFKSGAISEGMREDDIKIFSSTDDIKEHICEHIKENDAILVKASRGMHFEKIIKEIEGIGE